MKTEIICPLYNCSKYIFGLNKSIHEQKTEVEITVTYILTESDDDSEVVLQNNGIAYQLIKKGDFSHSLTRENAARQSNADIICFITQDIVIKDNHWLQKLIQPIIDGEAEATYSRQISRYRNLEKYTRSYNYGEKSFVKTKEDISNYGLNTFFYSDSASAIDKRVFEELNYYDGKDFSTNEDMYIAYKLITNGYKIKYCADSIVYHSHKFSLKETYERYRKFGEFFRENPYLSSYGENSSGLKMALYVLKESVKEIDLGTLARFPFDMFARFFGMKAGKNGKH